MPVAEAPASAPSVAPVASARAADAAMVGRAFRQLWKGTLTVAGTLGLVTASSTLTYVSTYPTVASRQAMAAALHGTTGLSVLFGPIDHIGTVGGYTAYKTFVFLTTIVALWAALAVTRLLRGEEDSGRRALVLAGQTDLRRSIQADLAAVGAAVAVVFAVTTAIVWAVGQRPSIAFGVGGSLVFGLGTVLPAVVLGAVAAVASQLARTRRLASGLTMGVIAVAFVLRMIGDSGGGARVVLWTTPFGWTELMAPFTANDLWPLVPATIAVVVLVRLALGLSERRDLGGGLLATRDAAPVRPFGLSSPGMLAVRLERAVLVAWTIGLAAMSFAFGIVTKVVADGLDQSSSADSTMSHLGATGHGPTQYLGVVFLFVGAVLALVPASQVGAARTEEATDRLAYVLSGPVRRARWMTARVALAAAAIVVISLVAAFCTWAGAASQGIDVRLGPTLVAGINVVPAALLALAIGWAVFAVVPRLAPMSVYLVVGWSLVIDLVGSLVTSVAWLTRLSVFHYATLAPAQDPDWFALGVMTAVAVAIVGGAVAVFDRRDLTAD